MFGNNAHTLDKFISRYDGVSDLLKAVKDIDKILTEPATATVGYSEADSKLGSKDQYSILEENDLPVLRFEDSIEKLKTKAKVSCVFGIEKPPTNINTESSYFRIYLGVPEEDAKPIDSNELTNLQLQIPSSCTVE